MFSRIKILLLANVILLLIPSLLSARPIKCFVPSKPWVVTIDLNNFEPSDVLAPKTVLGGRTKDGVNITIIIETTKPGTTPAETRKLYGYRYASGAGQKETIEEIDLDNVAVITYKWGTPNLPDANEKVQNRAKEWTQNMWGFNGYVVKDDIVFDIHLSADMSNLTKNQMLDIIKSFQINSSTELEESKKLFKVIETNPESPQNEKLLKDFIEKYPTNPEAYCYLSVQYLRMGQLINTKIACLRALENQKIQPFLDSFSLWKCYYNLGRYFAGSGEYDQSKQYSELCYKLARKARMPNVTIAASAYNLACLYAKTNQADKSIQYLREAVRLNPEYKEELEQNPSFDKIREDKRFKNLSNR